MGSGGAKPIKDIFTTYRDRLVAPEATVIETSCEVISELLAIKIQPSQLSYTVTTRTLYIKHSLVRSAVLPHRELVLAHLKGRIGSKSAPTSIV